MNEEIKNCLENGAGTCRNFGIVEDLRTRAEAAEARVAELEVAQEWIPVSEPPKKNCEYYLAELTNGRVEKVIYNGPGHHYTTWMIAGSHEPVDKLVVRYCKLPQPPKPEVFKDGER
jgi:hypothetical protein